MMADAEKRFPYNPPHFKEAYFYRDLFESHYEGYGEWIPYYWMPKWTNSKDPSARSLEHYRESDIDVDTTTTGNEKATIESKKAAQIKPTGTCNGIATNGVVTNGIATNGFKS